MRNPLLVATVACLILAASFPAAAEDGNVTGKWSLRMGDGEPQILEL